MDSKPPRIGRYEVRREIGRGMMGVVYEAWDPMLGRTVALKTVRAAADSRTEREAWERRFLTEARAAARLSHPSIVVVHDVGRDASTDLLYMALEYLRGETLAETLSSGKPLPWRQGLRLVGRVADALHHAHEQGVVHRDIKPANVIILPTGEPKILDFGIARLDAGNLTTPGDVCGTPLYMSPEQASGEAVDARSDIFSLGALAWAMLTGRSPFAAPTVPAILARVLHRLPPPISEIVPGVPSAVDDVIARAMAKSRDDRYPNARELASDVEDVLADRPPRHLAGWTRPEAGGGTVISGGEPAVALDVPAEPAPTSAPAPSRRRRRWPLPALLLALVAAAAVYFNNHPEDRALWNGLAEEGRRVVAVITAEINPPSGAPAFTPPESPIAARPQPSASPSGAAFDPGALTPSPPPALETPAEPSPLPSAAPATDAQTSREGTAASSNPEPPEAAATPASPSPSLVPASPKVVAATSPSPTPGRKAAQTAFLSVDWERRLKGGIIEVWVDGARVARETVDNRASKKLKVAPGRHEVMVRIRLGRDTRTGHTSGLFRASATRTLAVRPARAAGKLSLEWK